MALSAAPATRHLGTEPPSVPAVRANCTKAHGVAEMISQTGGRELASV